MSSFSFSVRFWLALSTDTGLMVGIKSGRSPLFTGLGDPAPVVELVAGKEEVVEEEEEEEGGCEG